MITLLVTDRNCNVVGDPVDDWESLKVVRNDNAPDSGDLTLAARPEVMAQLQPGNRLVVIRDDLIWAAGPMEIPQDWQEGLGGSDGGTDAPPPGDLTVNFASDDAIIAGHVVYPDPTLVASNGSQPVNYVRTSVNGEVLLRDLVNLNAGPGALVDRRIPQLVLGALAGVGTTTSLTTRWEPLGDILRSVALASGDLAFGAQQVGNQIEWTVRARRDLTSTARFSFDLNNLRSVHYKLSAPTVTSAIVGGQTSDEAPDQTIVEVIDTAAAAGWWRVEKFVDQGSVADDSTGELTQAGQEALAGGAGSVELSTITVDTQDVQAGRDYMVGDLVTVVLPTGIEVAEYVRSDTLTATPDGGEAVVSVVGTPDASTERRLVALIGELSARLGRLETRR